MCTPPEVGSRILQDLPAQSLCKLDLTVRCHKLPVSALPCSPPFPGVANPSPANTLGWMVAGLGHRGMEGPGELLMMSGDKRDCNLSIQHFWAQHTSMDVWFSSLRILVKVLTSLWTSSTSDVAFMHVCTSLARCPNSRKLKNSKKKRVSERGTLVGVIKARNRRERKGKPGENLREQWKREKEIS